MYLYGSFEHKYALDAVAFLRANGFLTQSQVTLLDVGENIGVTSVGLIRAGMVKQAIAFEPEPGNFRLLQQNVDQNGLAERVQCLQVAAGEGHSLLTMELSRENFADHRVRTTVPAILVEKHGESKRDTIEVRGVPLDDVPQIRELDETTRSGGGLLWIDVRGWVRRLRIQRC